MFSDVLFHIVAEQIEDGYVSECLAAYLHTFIVAFLSSPFRWAWSFECGAIVDNRQHLAC